jgi:hypothetical protein
MQNLSGTGQVPNGKNEPSKHVSVWVFIKLSIYFNTHIHTSNDMIGLNYDSSALLVAKTS